MQKLDSGSLNGLSRDQLMKMYDALQEQKRRLREKKAIYKPHQSQLEFHSSAKPFRFVFCANGWGKSAALVNEVLWAAMGWNPIRKVMTKVPAKVVVLLDNPSKIQDVFLKELQKWAYIREDQFHKRGKPFISEVTFDNGSSITFMSANAEPMSFESIEWDVLAIDEPADKAVFTALRRGGRKKGTQPRIIFVGTPITAPYLRKEIFEPWSRGELPDFECFRGTTDDNAGNLADGYIESFKQVLSEKEQGIRLRGEWFDLSGLALTHLFDRKTHVLRDMEWDRSHPVVVAIDPHSSKPHHAVMLGVDKDNYLYLLKELKSKTVARQFSETLKAWYAGYKVIDIVSDSAGNAESTSGEGFKSFLQVLRECGVQARATTFTEKDDEDFIARIQDALVIPTEANNFGQKTPKLRIFSDCLGTINDIENVQWVKYRNLDEYKPKLDISNKDFLSCLKYALATNLNFKKTNSKIYQRIKPVRAYGQRFKARRSDTMKANPQPGEDD